MADEIKRGVAYPRSFGAVVRLEDGTVVVARNGNGGRVHALAQVGAIKSGGRWVIVERARGV